MSSIASIEKRPNGKWRVRYRDPEGTERSKHFNKKIEAIQFRDRVRGDVVSGRYIDPDAGRKLFGEYARTWASHQAHRPSTVAHLETHLRNHILPMFEHRQIASIRKSEVQAWVKERSKVLAPSTLTTCFRWLSTIFRAAVEDSLITSSPCRGISLPKKAVRKVIPIDVATVSNLIDAMPDRYKAAVILGAGTGMRPSEVFGLVVSRINFVARRVEVAHQLVAVRGEGLSLGPLKSDASYRIIPLSDWVLNALSGHLREFGTGDMNLVFTMETGRPLTRARWGDVWRPAASKARISRGTGFHALRHFYASLLIQGGEQVKTVQSHLGHASAVETLNTYGHLWPDSEDRTRTVVDALFTALADSERTAEAS